MANRRFQNTLARLIVERSKDAPTEVAENLFIQLSLERIFDLDQDTIENSISDGRGDQGIDAIFSSPEKDLYLVQSKFHTDGKNSIPDVELKKMIFFIENCLFDNVAPINEKYVEYKRLLDDEDFGKVIVVFLTNGQFPKHLLEPIEDLKKKHRNQVDFQIYSENELSELFYPESAKEVDKISLKVEKDLGASAQSYISIPEVNGTRGYLTKIDLVELFRVVDEFPDIFNRNVRAFQSLKNKVNKQIEETIRDDNTVRFFGYLNNGITILCESCTLKAGGKTLVLTKPSVINGCQTASTVHEVLSVKPIEPNTAFVIVRIIETDDVSLTERVILASNTQTAVTGRDLVSLDRIQIQLEEEFNMYGYYYVRKRGLHSGRPSEKRIDLEIASQCYMAYELQMPAEAKNKKREIYNTNPNGYYRKIFNETITAEKLMRPYLLLKVIDSIIRKDGNYALAEKVTKGILRNAKLHILALLKFHEKEINATPYELEELRSRFETTILGISKVILNIARERLRTDPGFIPQYFFKSSQTYNELLDLYQASLIKG